MNDLIIVGGGIAGLAAATWCARDGLRVALLERANVLGGRARTDLQAGYAHNLGGHALYVDGHAARGLRELGVEWRGAPPSAGGILGIARGQLHRFPAGLLSMIATDLFGFAAKIEAARALATLVRTDAEPLRDVPWSEWLARIAPRPEVRDAIASIARVTTYANSPDRASAGATIAQIRRGVSPGVLYLDGGWQTLVDGLERAAVAAGVRLVRMAPVVSIVTAGGTVHGVNVASGERVAGRAVLLATGPATARALLGHPTLGGDLVATRAACLDLGLASLPRPGRLVAFGLDEPTYFSVHSAVAHLAERGATVHVMKYLDPDEPEDAARAEAEQTFARALASPPRDTSAPWRPWLVRVAVNLARDRLRRRKRTPYVGPWLPAPIETGEQVAEGLDPEHRYGLLESVTFAFLMACEALTPRQRAVLLLRDVLDYSVEETARALAMGLPNVKTTHHRARAAMDKYDAARRPPTRALQEQTRAALERFAVALSSGDFDQVEALLSPSAITINDTGGDYRAALRVVIGSSRVARLYLGLMKKLPPGRFVLRALNGLPALLVEVDDPPPRVAPRLVMRCEVGPDGRIDEIHVVLARAKLHALSA